MGRPNSHVLTGRVFFTAEESARFLALRARTGSLRATREALGCNELMLEIATGQGRVLPQTREKMLAKLAEVEAAS